MSNTDDQGCVVGAGQNQGVAGGNSTNSLCANELWDVQAVATDSNSSAQYTVNQGVALRVAATTACP